MIENGENPHEEARRVKCEFHGRVTELASQGRAVEGLLENSRLMGSGPEGRGLSSSRLETIVSGEHSRKSEGGDPHVLKKLSCPRVQPFSPCVMWREGDVPDGLWL